MNTTLSAETASKSRHASTADLPAPLALVIRRNLAGDGCCPLDHLAEAREATTQLAAYLLDQHTLPDAVALELEAAELAMRQAELHLRMAATRCA